ncbi:MAG: hypothetical protein H6668_04650 [Ardenticatenaceae bacterium]|nr:hypothetical protein [Ardenticatenaceae bacterium]
MMTRYIQVPLSDQRYRQLKAWANRRQLEIGEAVAEYLVENPPDSQEWLIPPSEEDARLEAEKQAYLHLYPQLKEQFWGKHVAIYQGQLVDHDTDYAALFERIDDRFPDEFVWLTQVADKPMETISFRSPRFVEETT